MRQIPVAWGALLCLLTVFLVTGCGIQPSVSKPIATPVKVTATRAPTPTSHTGSGVDTHLSGETDIDFSGRNRHPLPQRNRLPPPWKSQNPHLPPHQRLQFGSVRTPKPLPTQPHPQTHFTHPPAMQININSSYTAHLSTSYGQIVISLSPKTAPLAVNNFVFLARHGFYTHVLFWRVIKGFMIQTGDPTGTGEGGPGYTFKVESAGNNFVPGTVAMANTSQPNSNGSQFFICEGGACASNLDTAPPPGYTIFGHVVQGMNVVHAIAAVPTHLGADGQTSAPNRPVYLNSVTITSSS